MTDSSKSIRPPYRRGWPRTAQAVPLEGPALVQRRHAGMNAIPGPRAYAVGPIDAGTRSAPADSSIALADRGEICRFLNECLADCVDLQAQSRQARWHITGADTPALHALIESAGDLANEFVDRLAERIVALGGIAQGTVGVVAQRSGANAHPSEAGVKTFEVDTLASALAVINISCAYDLTILAGYGDSGSQDLVAELSAAAHNYARAIEAYLQAGASSSTAGRVSGARSGEMNGARSAPPPHGNPP